MEFKNLIANICSIISTEEDLPIKNFKIDFENQQIIIDTGSTINSNNAEIYHSLSDYLINNINIKNKYIIYKTPVRRRYVIKEKNNEMCPPLVECIIERKSFAIDIQGISVELPVHDDLILYNKKEFIKELKRCFENGTDAIGVYEDAIIIYSISSRGTLVSNIEISRDEHDIIKDQHKFQHDHIYEKYDDNFEELKKIVLKYIINLVKGGEQ